eukprot:TRINITY_DN4967_c0_g2_i1.p1 TRINITY_DN4967_c0_g2~~TRINITY_DN4967_c0_g2_i1.p1  ORF type:complete len:150 (-),score=16.87 TRINITY_DN4967_c0_g2_i1:165-578(-)
MEGICLKRIADSPADEQRGWVRAAHFDVLENEVTIGHVDLRLGDTEHLRLYGGHIGYNIQEPWRGCGIAAWAVRQILPVAKSQGLMELWITCNPDNVASRRTAEKSGFEFIETVSLPTDCDMYLEGEREKRRFRLVL